MCYFTKKILNKRFLPNKKNGGEPPICLDERFRYVEVECGECFECRKKKRNQWRIRNYEQLKETPTAIFFTGTVSPERYNIIKNRYGLKDDNEIITKIHRLFLERIRKQTKKSIKHWCVTEKGHTNTRRIHLHGLYYASNGMTKYQLLKLLRDNWIDGYCYNGKYVNERTINYVSKYMTKKDEDNPEFKGKVLCSPGLGAEYVKRNKERYKWQGEESKEDYHCKNGQNVALPRYYKEKFYNEDQRQLLWMFREDSGIKYIGNFKITINNEEDRQYYETLRKQHNEEGAAIHGDDIDTIQWRKEIRRDAKEIRRRERAIEEKQRTRKNRQKRSEKAREKLEEDLSAFAEYLYSRPWGCLY